MLFVTPAGCKIGAPVLLVNDAMPRGGTRAACGLRLTRIRLPRHRTAPLVYARIARGRDTFSPVGKSHFVAAQTALPRGGDRDTFAPVDS